MQLNCKQKQVADFLDMASYNIVANDLEFFSLLINKYVDIVFANEEEAKAFTGKEPEEALGVIAKKCSIAIVKVGASGSYIRKGTEEIKVSAIPVQKVVDTTGAGDYFASGFLYGLTCGYSLDKCKNRFYSLGKCYSGNRNNDTTGTLG
jgi:sugar/nucleoside kinase (ribokinase family)